MTERIRDEILNKLADEYVVLPQEFQENMCFYDFLGYKLQNLDKGDLQ
jgi:hypothetical protein